MSEQYKYVITSVITIDIDETMEDEKLDPNYHTEHEDQELIMQFRNHMGDFDYDCYGLSCASYSHPFVTAWSEDEKDIDMVKMRDQQIVALVKRIHELEK